MSLLSERIKSSRQQLELSQAALAEATGVSQPTVANWESGSHIPRSAVLKRISQVLNVESDWLLTGGSSRAHQVSTDYLSRPTQHIPIYSANDMVQNPIGYMPFASELTRLMALAVETNASDENLTYICAQPDALTTGPYAYYDQTSKLKISTAKPVGASRIIGRVIAELKSYT